VSENTCRTGLPTDGLRSKNRTENNKNKVEREKQIINLAARYHKFSKKKKLVRPQTKGVKDKQKHKPRVNGGKEVGPTGNGLA